MADNRLVSCVCVTRNRVPMLRRSVACYLAQTYEPRELVMLWQTDDPATGAYVQSLREPTIRHIAAAPGIPLGALRNVAIAECRGRYIAQWDDDDWYDPQRLTMQIDALLISHYPACVLSAVIMYEVQTGQAYISQRRTWEGSLVAEKAALPTYPDLAKSEDHEVIKKLFFGGRLVLVERPDMYIYTFHGTNTWDRVHWGELLRGSRKMSETETRKVQARLGAV